MVWFIATEISDKGINVTGCDSRVFIPYEECGYIFEELFSYAFDLKSLCFSKIIFQDSEILNTDVKLPRKDKNSNFNDLRYTINSYRYIMSVFLSAGIIPELKTIEENIWFEIVNNDIINRADTLEYYLLNNITLIQNQRGYYGGKLELALYRLIQEMYLLARYGNKKCQWMLAFNTPLQIWFVVTMQITYKICTSRIKVCNKKYYENIIKRTNNIHQDCSNTIADFKNTNSFDMVTALHYTIAQLIIDHVSPIGTFYTTYLSSIKSQAYAISRKKLKAL